MSRLQLALDVDDLEASIAFYQSLFGVEVAKRRPGYANLVVADPPLKLVLIENRGHGGTLNHLGVEVESTEEVLRWRSALGRRGVGTRDEMGSTCCYAVQDKVWVTGSPDAERWEVYTVTGDAGEVRAEPGPSRPRTPSGPAACCGPAPRDEDPCARGEDVTPG